jgi:hypothetical protein
MFTHPVRMRSSHSFLGSILEVSDELWDIVIIFISGFAVISKGTELGLQELVLLWTNLLEDIWHHILELSGFWGTGNDQKVFSNRELG